MESLLHWVQEAQNKQKIISVHEDTYLKHLNLNININLQTSFSVKLWQPMHIQSWSELLAPLVNMIKEGSENKCALLILMSVLCGVSCVPASCVHIWFVSCPRLMWLLVNSVPGVCMWLCIDYPCVFIVLSVQLDFIWSTRYSLVFLSVSLALSCLDVVIKDYYLSLRPRLRVLVPPCCVYRDTFWSFIF